MKIYIKKPYFSCLDIVKFLRKNPKYLKLNEQVNRKEIIEKKVLIASYDAGGAEILSNWLKYKKPKAFVVVDGPAKKFLKKIAQM